MILSLNSFARRRKIIFPKKTNYSFQYWSCLSPVIAGRKGSAVTAVFLSGKGTLSICGVTQFKELQCKNRSVKEVLRVDVFIKRQYEWLRGYRILLWSARSFCSSSQLSWQKTHLCKRVIINFSTCSIIWVIWASGKPENQKQQLKVIYYGHVFTVDCPDGVELIFTHCQNILQKTGRNLAQDPTASVPADPVKMMRIYDQLWHTKGRLLYKKCNVKFVKIYNYMVSFHCVEESCTSGLQTLGGRAPK